MTGQARGRVLGLLFGVLLAESARAQAPHADGADSCRAERFVVLRASPALDAALMDEVRTDLAAELEPRGVAVCAEDTPRPPAVVVDVHPLNGALVIELDDRVTAKRVARDLSLAKIPDNGRALAVAIAIDELLRASWAELELRQRSAAPEVPSSAQQTLPRVETRTVNARGPYTPPPPSALDLSVALGYLGAKDDFDAFALSVGAAAYPFSLGWVELRASALGSLAADTPRGDVLARGFGASLTMGACTPREGSTVFGCVGAIAGFDWLVFRGVRPEGAEADRKGAAIAQLGGVGRLAVNVSRRLYLLADLSLAATAVGARATDGETTLMGVSGLLLAAQLGLGMRR